MPPHQALYLQYSWIILSCWYGDSAINCSSRFSPHLSQIHQKDEADFCLIIPSPCYSMSHFAIYRSALPLFLTQQVLLQPNPSQPPLQNRYFSPQIPLHFSPLCFAIIILIQSKRMKEYFKYLSIEQLKDQIKDRFAGAKHKIDQLHEHQRFEESVDRKFYDYVSEIKSKQRQYENILNQPTELNCLLKKRRNKINESLQKYERNVKCKTLSDFKVQESPIGKKYDRLQDFPISLHEVYQLDKPLFATVNQHALLTQERNSYLNPRSKTQSNFFYKKENQEPATPPQFGSQRHDESRKLRSITKVINITVKNDHSNTPQHKDTIFSFAKANSNQKPQDPAKMNAKKAIRFETTPNQEIKGKAEEEQSERLKSRLGNKAVNNACIKKIKERIKSNFRNCKLVEQSKARITQLQLAFEQECMQRLQLKQQLLSSSVIYQQLKAKSPKIPTLK